MGPRAQGGQGPATLVPPPPRGYTLSMKENTVTNAKLTLSLIAALLVTAPSAQAKRTPAGGPYRQWIAKGVRSLEADNHAQAVAHFKQALEARKTSEAYFLLGYALYQKGFAGGSPEHADRNAATEAINAYAAAMALDPDLKTVNAPHKIHHSMALCYEALGAQDKAITAYKHAFQSDPTNPMLPLYAARLRYRMHDMPRSAANLALALRKARAVKKDKVIAKLVRADPLFSGMLESDLHRDIVSEYDGTRAAKAEASSLAAGEAAPASVAPTAPALDKAEGEEMRDSVGEPRQDQRRQILAEDEGRASVLKRLALADEEYRFARHRDAIDGYNETLRLNQEAGTLNPTQLSLVYERMGTAYNRLGLSAPAVRALRYAVQEMPANASAHYQISLAYAVSGKYSQSLRALNEAFRNAPSDSELRKMMLLAKTDSELEPIRDLPGFRATIVSYSERLQARR